MKIRAVVFDLDGTLYVNRELGREIHQSACRHIAACRGISYPDAYVLVKETKQRLSDAQGYEVSLTHTCTELGADLRELHRHFSKDVAPDDFLSRDERVVALLRRLAERCDLYLYTNNNLSLSSRVMGLIGIEGMFRRVFTIEDTWRPKPDQEALEGLLREIGRTAPECLFVGDRYHIDLALPERMGARVFLSSTVEELLTLDSLLAAG